MLNCAMSQHGGCKVVALGLYLATDTVLYKLIANLFPPKSGLLVSLSKCGKTGLITPTFLQGITTGLPAASTPPVCSSRSQNLEFLTLC